MYQSVRKNPGSSCISHNLPIDAVVAEVNFLEYWNEKSFVKANVLPHAEGGALGQYEVLQTEELTSDAPSIDPHSQALPVQVGAQSDDLQVVACNIDIAFVLFVWLTSVLRLFRGPGLGGFLNWVVPFIFFLQWQSVRWTNWRG